MSKEYHLVTFHNNDNSGYFITEAIDENIVDYMNDAAVKGYSVIWSTPMTKEQYEQSIYR